MIESGSLENNERLRVLYHKHDTWLRKVAYNLTNNHDVVDDLIQDLYLYLGEKRNQNLWYLDSFNLKYCYHFIHSRWNNLISREKKSIYTTLNHEIEEEYDPTWDYQLHQFEKDVHKELDRLEKTGDWASAKLYRMYIFGNQSMEELSSDIGISKSTLFLSVKKIKLHLQDTIDKPIKPKD